MAKVCECHWVPRLRKLTKQVIKSCAGCKRFQAIAPRNPPPRPLPVDRRQGSTPLEVIGIDFAGPFKYQISRSETEGKAYIALYSCSLMRAVYLDVTQSLETSEFIRSLKQFIARRGRPVKIYSDNGKTFLGTEKWLKQIMHDDQVQDYLAHQNMKWQFNLSRPSWWGGHRKWHTYVEGVGRGDSCKQQTLKLCWRRSGATIADTKFISFPKVNSAARIRDKSPQGRRPLQASKISAKV